MCGSYRGSAQSVFKFQKYCPSDLDYVFPGSVSGVMVALQYVVVLAVSLPDFSILGFPVGSDWVWLKLFDSWGVGIEWFLLQGVINWSSDKISKVIKYQKENWNSLLFLEEVILIISLFIFIFH